MAELEMHLILSQVRVKSLQRMNNGNSRRVLSLCNIYMYCPSKESADSYRFLFAILLMFDSGTTRRRKSAEN